MELITTITCQLILYLNILNFRAVVDNNLRKHYAKVNSI